MHVKAVGLRVVSQAAVLGDLEFRRSLGAAVNRAPLLSHPLAHALQAVEGALVELAAGGWANVEQQVAAFTDCINQHLDQLLDAFPTGFIAMIPP